MKSTLYILAILAVLTLVLRTVPHAEAAEPLKPVGHRAYDAQFAAQEVTFNEARVRRDPGGAIGWRQLASAYLAAGRESDSQILAKKAEQAASKSLSIRISRNAGAAVILSEALLEQHRFSDALAACEQSLKIEPENDFAERTITDIYFEIGRYEEARNMIVKHPEWRDDSGGLALLARESEITGRTDIAIVQLQRAVELAESEADVPATSVSWFHVKLGDLLTRNGQFSKAEAEYAIALRESPRNWKAFSSVVRLRAQQSDHKGVLLYGQKLNEIAPMTDVVGLMEDASRALGDEQNAKRFAQMVLKMNQSAIDAGVSPTSGIDQNRVHTHDRMFSQYLADHNLMLPLAQHAASHDLANRKDIYTYDTYAWASFRLAESLSDDTKKHVAIIESKQCIDKALALGTKDAKLLYHSGLIEQALGHSSVSKERMDEALNINPNLRPVR
jgi:tetratricopeptide (TPR) repeat protein